MLIAVLGGTGKTGRVFMLKALAAGHRLRVLCRTPAVLAGLDGVDIVPGDAQDAAALSGLVAGTDCVVSFLGHGKQSPLTLQADAIAALLSALHPQGPRRIVCITGTGVPDPADPPQPLLTRIETFFLERLSPGRVSDGVAQTELLRVSGLRWTAIRSPLMLGGQGSGKVRSGYFAMGPFEWVRREDVAGFALSCLENDSYINECPMLRR